jgi:TonB family protein
MWQAGLGNLQRLFQVRAPLRGLAFAWSAAFSVTLAGAGTARARGKDEPAAQTAHKLTKPPRLVHFVQAPYPESEKAAGRAASVVLELGINASGAVEKVVVKESAGTAFDAAAAQAAGQFVFEPAEVDGKPAAIRLLYRYAFVLRTEAPTTGILAGQVRDVRTKRPLAAVHITVDGGRSATTDADGYFRFDDVLPGKHTIALSGSHLTELQTTESLEAGRQTTVTYDVEPQDQNKPAEDRDDLEIVVTPPAVEKQVVSTEVSADEGRRIPGTQGDVLKVVENLPGVARASVGSAQLVVWGAAPEDTRVFVDGVPIPSLYHQGGFRSVIHSDMVNSVELLPGGWGAEYGRGIGGLVNVQLKPIESDGVHGSVSGDLLDSAADVRARWGERVAVEVAGRKSYLDSVLPLFTSRNVGQYVPIPRYYDAQTRMIWDVSPGETLEIGGLVSSDTVDDTVPSADPTSVQQQTHDTSFRRIWLRYKARASDGAEILIVPSFGTNSDSLVDQFGSVPTNLDVEAAVASLRASWRKKVASWVTLTAGVDGQFVQSRFSRTGSNTSPPRTGDDYVFGQAPTDEIAHDEGTTVAASMAPFGTADFSLMDGTLHIVPGVRVDPYLLTVSSKAPTVGSTPPTGLFSESTQVEPRLAVRWSPVPALTWKAGWGIYHQPPAPADLSAVFGNPTLGLESAEHLLAGVSVGSPDTLSFEMTAFRTTSQSLAVRSPLPSPLVAQALVATGIGRSRGLQFLVRKQLSKRLFGWITYTLSKSERADAPGAPYYPYDFDQTHVLGALASLNLGGGFEVGGRFRFATGYPRTPVTGAYFDVQTGTYEPFFGQLNSIRIPDFVQVDVRVSKRFTMGQSAIEAYLDLQNVTNRANPEEIVYSPDYSQRRYITGLPILPVVGARLTW